MALISKLKRLIGLDGRGPSGGTTVTVEREPDTATERAVKESPPADESTAPARTAEESLASSPATEAPAAERAGSDEPVDTLSGIGSAYADRLADAGIETVADLAAADAAALDEATGIGEGRLEGWIEQANDR